MRRSVLVPALSAILLAAGCGKTTPGASQSSAPQPSGGVRPASEELMTKARALFSAVPATPPELPGNPASAAKVELGKALYFEPRLSASHVISCASCHNIGLGGADAEPNSIGHRWQHGARNAPTTFNAVFNKAQFWDGRAKDLEQQAGGPMVNPLEMASPEAHVVEQLKGIAGYRPLFSSAFPGEPDPITLANAEKAIAVFEATLTTPNAPFDRYLAGQAGALTPMQKQGLTLFIDKGCSSCHNGVNVGGAQYAPFGVVAKPGAELLPPADKGRFQVTRSPGDEYVYKVPTLRNIALTAPYFHTGAVWDLRQAVAIMGTSQLGASLTDDEIGKITAFMQSLTGDQPKVTVPILPPSDATTPPPRP
jgi:cytochrome c peroxidase